MKLSALKMAKCAQTAGAFVSKFNEHTVPVIFQINELVIPLCHDTQGVFEESDDDEEAADHGKVSELSMSGQQRVLSSSLSGISHGALCSWQMSTTSRSKMDIRFQRVGYGIQPVLDLAGLFTYLVQRTRVVGCICATGTAEAIVLGTEIVAGRATDVSHLECCSCEWVSREGSIAVEIEGREDTKVWRTESESRGAKVGKLDDVRGW